MLRTTKISFFVLIFLLVSSLNCSEISLNSYPLNPAQDIYLQAKEGKASPSSEKVLGAYWEKQSTAIVNPYQVYSYEQMIKDADALQKQYPDLIKTKSLGYSTDGREILLIKLGRGAKKITFNGSHHAREYISTTLLMKMVEEYAYSYEEGTLYKGYNVRQILDQVTIFIVPMVNPDGVTLVQYGPDKLKNSRDIKKINGSNKTYKSWKANARGVDLNYQYPYGWDRIGKLTGPSPEGFKGTAPATEKETKIMMKFTMGNPFLIHVAYHTQGGIIYWYNGQTGDLYKQSYSIGKKLSNLTGYKLLTEGDQKNSYGGYKDWSVTTFKKPGYTIEICPYIGNFPYPDKWFDDVWNKAGATGLLFAQEAINMKGLEYEAYDNNNKLVQLFNNQGEAIEFVKKYQLSEVKHQGKSLWKK